MNAQQYIPEAVLAARQAAREERARLRKVFHHGYAVGDILNGSWGWEETHQEFWQVVSVNPKTNAIVVRKIAERHAGGAGFMCEQVMPVKDDFIGEEYRAIVQMGHNNGDKGYFNVPVNPGSKFKVSVDEWDGKPKYSSWYA